MNCHWKCLLLSVILVVCGFCFIYQTSDDWKRISPPLPAPQLREMLQYFSWSNSTNCRLFYQFGGTLNRNPQLTFIDGQKAVCMDPAVAPVPDQCLVYSFGNNDEWSFDDQIALFGCNVHVFDPSVYSWDHQRSNRTWFHRIGITEREDQSRNVKGWRMSTLEAIRRRLGHQKSVIDYLKMDIEGGEWPILSQWLTHWSTDDWMSIKQLALEVHLGAAEEIPGKYQIIRRLEEAGFSRFFARENPWSRIDGYLNGTTAANCYELAWFNRRYLNVNQTRAN